MRALGTRNKIIAYAKTRPSFGSRELVRQLKLSRQTVADHLTRLVAEGQLAKTGSTRGSSYRWIRTPTKTPPPLAALTLCKKLKGLQEDRVYSEILLRMGLKSKLSENARRIFSYAFTEMLNNAIDHSHSQSCRIHINLSPQIISFSIRDFGIGAFSNVQKTFRLQTEFDALEHLFKGRQTTDPKRHSGEGIFFTSRIADRFSLMSHALRAVRDNQKDDLFVKDIRKLMGTEVGFEIKTRTTKKLSDLFKKFTNQDFEFENNVVSVKLSASGGALSRSEARRLLFGLDKFKKLQFNFSGVKEIGQGFADEIFRVFANEHSDISLSFSNVSPAVSFMITRAIRAR